MSSEKRANTIMCHDILPPELWMVVVDTMHPLTFATLFVAHPRLGVKLLAARNKGAADKICMGFAYGTLSPTDDVLVRYAHDSTFTTEGCVQLRRVYESIPVKDSGSILATYIQSTTLDGDSHCRVMLLTRGEWTPLNRHNYDPLRKAPYYDEAWEMEEAEKDDLAIVDRSNIVCNAPLLNFTPDWVRIYNDNDLWLVSTRYYAPLHLQDDLLGLVECECFCFDYERRGGRFSAVYDERGLLDWCEFADGRVEQYTGYPKDEFSLYDKHDVLDMDEFEERIQRTPVTLRRLQTDGNIVKKLGPFYRSPPAPL